MQEILFLMKYIYLLIFNIFTLQNLSFASDNTESICKEFLIPSKETEIYSNYSENTTFKSGVLWKIISPNKKINYLFGTIHSQEYSVTKFSPEVRLALIKSKKLILETIPSNNANIIYKDMMYYKNGNQLNDLLEEPLFKKLTELVKLYDLSESELINLKYMKPWAAFNLIGRPKTVRAPTLESNLLKLAQERMLKIESLETMDEIISSLDKLSINDQLNILKDTICNRKQIIEEIKILINLYIQRNALGIVKFSQRKHANEKIYTRFIEIMLHERNKKMLKKITKEFGQGNVFVAVGILHLIAKDGILENLQDLDYAIEVIY